MKRSTQVAHCKAPQQAAAAAAANEKRPRPHGDAEDGKQVVKKMLQALARAVKAVVTVNRELHASASDRTCRIIKFDLKGKGVRFSTGDHIAILNRNRFAPPTNCYRSCSP